MKWWDESFQLSFSDYIHNFPRFLVASWVEWLAFQNDLHLCVSDCLPPSAHFWPGDVSEGLDSPFPFSFASCRKVHTQKDYSFASDHSDPLFHHWLPSVVCVSGQWYLFLLCFNCSVLALGNVFLWFISCLLGDVSFDLCRQGTVTVASSLGRIFIFSKDTWPFPAFEWNFMYWMVAEDGLHSLICGHVPSFFESSQHIFWWSVHLWLPLREGLLDSLLIDLFVSATHQDLDLWVLDLWLFRFPAAGCEPTSANRKGCLYFILFFSEKNSASSHLS